MKQIKIKHTAAQVYRNSGNWRKHEHDEADNKEKRAQKEKTHRFDLNDEPAEEKNCESRYNDGACTVQAFDASFSVRDSLCILLAQIVRK